MFFSLLYRLSISECYLRKINPYNVESLFISKHTISFEDKKNICVFLDFLSSLISENKLSANDEQVLVIFNKKYSELDCDSFFEIVEQHLEDQNLFLNFLFKKLIDLNRLEKMIQQFDHQKLSELFEDVV